MQPEEDRAAPLAVRMRPRTLEEFVGQGKVLGAGSLLQRALLADRLGSLILYGPPGTGKTTFARIASATTRSHFEQINAVTSGVADIRRVIQEAEERRKYHSRKTTVFIDEIHRFNKSQQDALLPAVEDGVITLIGATTENPFFSINAPLLSRARVIRFEPLSPEEIERLIDRALTDRERGLGMLGLSIDPAAKAHLVRISGGDARVALNVLELAADRATDLAERAQDGHDEEGARTIDLAAVEEASNVAALRYDRAGDQHYDVASAFIKSMRGSDPQATLYWLARMLEAGEDPRFIARRIIIHASEDVGNADPMALCVATSAAQALEWVGLPEAQLALAQAALYVATAPKSNAVCVGILEAREAVRRGALGAVPPHLRDASYRGAQSLGHGVGYRYPHDDPRGYVPQQYLPAGLESSIFYNPTDRGEEAKVRERLRALGQSLPPFP